MRALTGAMSKVVAVAALLTASIAVPALLVQVGALDAVGHEFATPAPNSAAQIVVATSESKPVAVPHRVARRARAAVRPQPAVVQARTRAPKPSTGISTPVSSVVSTPRASTPSAPQTTTTPAPTTPSTPSTPSTP